MQYLILICILASFGLCGCGAINGESDYVPYTEALETHSTSEANRIVNQSQTIMNIISETPTETKTEKVLLAVVGMMSVERLQPTHLNIIKPTTGFDVLNRHLGSIASTALTGVLGYFSYDAIKEMATVGGNTFNGDVTASGSFNNSEQHITYSDNASATQQPYEVTQPDVTVVDQPEPVIVTGEGD